MSLNQKKQEKKVRRKKVSYTEVDEIRVIKDEHEEDEHEEAERTSFKKNPTEVESFVKRCNDFLFQVTDSVNEMNGRGRSNALKRSKFANDILEKIEGLQDPKKGSE